MNQIKREDFDSVEEYAAALEAQNQKLSAQVAKGGTISMKVSDKGALSVYGLGRFPVTLYKGQWVRLFGHAQAIVEFMKAHDSDLAEKKAA